MTLVDLMCLVAGVAVGSWVMMDIRPGWRFFPPFWLRTNFVGFRSAQVVAIAAAFVAFGRVASQRRMPRPAEWLAIAVAAWAVADRPELNVTAWRDPNAEMHPEGALSYDAWLWMLAGLAFVTIATCLAVVRLGRRILPTWSKTLLLAGAAMVAVAAPFEVFDVNCDDLLARLYGFGPSIRNDLLFRVGRLLAGSPTGLLVYVPAVAAALDRLAGRRWAWHEWAGAAGSVAAGVLSLAVDQADWNPAPLGTTAAEWALELAWSVAIAAVGRLIVVRLAPAWDRWIEPPEGQGRPATDSFSEISTRST
jgi:hypothetical protein